MLLKAKHHLLIYPFFRFYAGWIIRKHFGRVELKNEFYDRHLPVLLLANHFSWWDGFFAMYLNVNVIKRKFHFMMLEEQLKKFSFFNKTGGYSIQKKSRSVIESIDYTAELLISKQNMVLLFPQGKIETVYTQNFKFEAGIERILGRISNEIQIVFMVNLIDYFSNRKPGLYMYVSEYQYNKFDTKTIQAEYNAFYARCISENAFKSES